MKFIGEPALLFDPITLVPNAVFLLLFGPLPEELGWREYALDGLQARWNALAASRTLGVRWAGWHLPLFAQFWLTVGLVVLVVAIWGPRIDSTLRPAIRRHTA